MRAILILIASTLWLCLPANAARVLNLGASGATGYPYSAVDGDCIGGLENMFVRKFASRIGATVGGTPTTDIHSADYCTDAGGAPHSTCTNPAGVPCGVYPAVCDLARSGAAMNSNGAQGRTRQCYENGTGTCNATSQVGFIVAEILAETTPNEIKAVFWAPGIANDMTSICLWLAVGFTTTLDEWKASITAGLSDLRTAIDASVSPNAQIIFVPEGKWQNIYPNSQSKKYWDYASNNVDCRGILTGAYPRDTSGGFWSGIENFQRTVAATYGAIVVENISMQFRDDLYARYSEQTYYVTNPTECSGGACTNGHYNKWAGILTGDRVWNQYLIATGATDTDSDGLADAVEAVIGTNSSLADTDSDCVPDGTEFNAWEVFGGQRDPLNGSDFFDTNGDCVIDGVDIKAVKQRAMLGIPSRAFSTTYQRLPPPAYVIGEDPNDNDPWDTLAVTSGLPYPNNQPSVQDWLLIEQQRGHRGNCLADYSDCLLATGQECQRDEQCLSNACGCDGSGLSYRQCLPSTLISGYSADPRRCTNLGWGKWCIENGDCATNNCTDAIISGIFVCN